MLHRAKSLLFLAVLLSLLPARLCGAEAKHDHSIWEKEVRAYEQKDATNAPPKGGVLFVGSSGIRLWTTLASDFPGLNVINRGVGGCEIVDCTYFAERILFPYEPRKIVFRCGGNDLWNGKSAEAVANDFKEFVRTVHAKLPDCEILFLSWNPTIARRSGLEKEKRFNALVREFISGNPKLRYVETADLMVDAKGEPRADVLAADKLHFNAEGYRLLAERVRSALREGS